MSTALLQELQQEVRRLYIAGSELSAGDFRLKRLLPRFEQLGEKAPVFGKLAEGITKVIAEKKPEEGGAEALQDLQLLLGSVLRTQGQTAPAGEEREWPGSPAGLQTDQSYRRVSEVQTALSTTGSGRYEVVIEAFPAGVFADLRLLPYVIKALGDPYVEIAEYVAEKILPSYGPQILPFLIGSFDRNGGKSEYRKLQVIGRLGGETVLDFVYAAAESGSDEIRALAIELLAGRETYLESLLTWSRDKKKTVREAAYLSLAQGGSPQAEERLAEAFAGKDKDLVADALHRYPTPKLADWLAPQLEELVRQGLEVEDKKQAKSLNSKLESVLIALGSVRGPQLDALARFIAEHAAVYTSLGWLEVTDYCAGYVEASGSEEGMELLSKLEEENARYLSNTFRLAHQVLPPEELYERYVGATRSKLKGAVTKKAVQREKELLQTIERMVSEHAYVPFDAVWRSEYRNDSFYRNVLASTEQIQEKWDPRWLDWFISRDMLKLVCVFARPGHEAAVDYLREKLKKNPEFRNKSGALLLEGLERAEAPKEERHELLVAAIEDKRNATSYQFEPFVFEKLCELPDGYADRLQAALSLYRYECVKQLEYVIDKMRGRRV